MSDLDAALARRRSAPTACSATRRWRRCTTFKVGGPADWLVERADARRDRRRASLAARAHGVPVTMLGGGSNVLIADRGIRGLVIRLRGGEVARVGDRSRPRRRRRHDQRPGALDDQPRLRRPRSVGRHAGHGRRRDLRQRALRRARLIGDLVESVRAGDAGRHVVAGRRPTAMEFGYDYSRLQRTRRGRAVGGLSRVGRGEPAALRAVARESLAFRKRTQPLESPSAGCIFQNPDPARDRVPDGIPPSAGALVDRAGLKGARDGRRARVADARATSSSTTGGATAARHPRADRALPATPCARPLRRRSCAKRSSISGLRRPRAGAADMSTLSDRRRPPARGPRRRRRQQERGAAADGGVPADRRAVRAAPTCRASRDVEVMARLLLDLGAEVEGIGTHDAAHPLRARSTNDEPDRALVGRLRGSVLLLGPLLARRGRAHVAPPGGDFPARRTIAHASRGA